jgi:hypothetical protein
MSKENQENKEKQDGTEVTKPEVKHPAPGTKVNTTHRVEGISTGKNKHLPSKGKTFSAHPVQMAYFIDKGYATEVKK